MYLVGQDTYLLIKHTICLSIFGPAHQYIFVSYFIFVCIICKLFSSNQLLRKLVSSPSLSPSSSSSSSSSPQPMLSSLETTMVATATVTVYPMTPHCPPGCCSSSSIPSYCRHLLFACASLATFGITGSAFQSAQL